MTLRHYTLLLLTAATLSLQAQVRLVNDGRYARLTIDGQPMLVLGGELSNSAATCPEDIAEVMPRMAYRHHGTSLSPRRDSLTSRSSTAPCRRPGKTD